jgi:hypothetical protein
LLSISDYRGTSSLLEIGNDRMILRDVAVADLSVEDFLFDDSASQFADMMTVA